MRIAFTRAVSPAIVRCALTHLERRPIDVERARLQHHEYEATLERLGCRVRRLPPEPELPDAVFVEDTAVVLDEMAIIARPGAASRRAEVPTAADALRPHRELLSITAPATLDGGDVLRAGRTVFVGDSERTNEAGREQLRALLEPHGYRVVVLPVRGCLHLKTAVTEVAPDTLLINPAWTDAGALSGFRTIEVDPREPFAANALRLDDAVVHPLEFPRTRARLERAGIPVVTVPADELARAEAGVTCCSLILDFPREAGADKFREDHHHEERDA